MVSLWHRHLAEGRDIDIIAERQRGIAAAMLGLESPPSTDLDAVRLVRRGLATSAIAALQTAGVDQNVLSRIIPRRTLERRRRRGEALSLEKSERAYRTVSVLALGEAVFGNRDKALSWMPTPKHRFDDETPIDLIGTGIGARLIEEALIQIDDGFFA